MILMQRLELLWQEVLGEVYTRDLIEALALVVPSIAELPGKPNLSSPLVFHPAKHSSLRIPAAVMAMEDEVSQLSDAMSKLRPGR